VGRRLLTLLGAVLLLTVAASSGSAGVSATANGAAPLQTGKPLSGKLIWHLDGASGNPAFTALAQGIYNPLRAAGGKLVRSYAQNASGQLDIAAMAQAFDRAIAAKPAAITFFVLDNKALGPQARKARAAGIPVFAFAGKPVRSVPVNGYLEPDDYGHGTALGRTLASGLSRGAEWTVIAAAPTPNVERMLNGATASMRQAGMKFVGNRNNQRNLTDIASGGQQIMQALIQRYPNLRGVVAFNDDTALGAIAAIKAAGKRPGRDILVVSRNGTPDAIASVKRGELFSTCDIGIPTLGITLGRAVRQHLTRQRLSTNARKIAAPPASRCIVTKRNVNRYVPWEKQIPYVKIEER
jgi:ABC-type sugar transport system substrate-binding protein